MRRTALLLAIILVSTLAFAGVTFTSVSKTEQDGRTTQTRVRAYVSGSRARIEFLENEQDPVFSKGKYLLSRDGGKTMMLVDPAQKTTSPVDFESMTRDLRDTMERMHVKSSVGAPKLERLVDTPGEAVAGMPTRHYRYRTTYTTTLEVMGQKTAIETVITDDLWTTKSLSDPALALWLKKETPSTGDPNADALLKSEMNKVAGFPVKRVTKTETTDDHGHHSASTTSMEVLEAHVAPVAAAKFAVPASFRQVALPVPEEDEGDGAQPHRD